MKNNIKVSIIILNHNSGNLTETCLAKIFDQSTKCPYEVIVVDNGSRGNPRGLTEKWGVRDNATFIFSPENRGYGQGNQLGINIARGEYILVVNPDIGMLPLTIDRLVDFMDRNRDVGLVAPQLIYEDGTVQDSYRRFPTPFDICIKRTALRKIGFFKRRLAHSLMWDKDPEKTEDVDWVVGACVMIRKSVLDNLNFIFDKRFFLFFEDTDLCRRLWENSWRVVYFPKAKALHHHKRLSEGGIMDIFRKKTLRIHIASGVKYFTKYAFKKSPRSSNT